MLNFNTSYDLTTKEGKDILLVVLAKQRTRKPVTRNRGLAGRFEIKMPKLTIISYLQWLCNG